MVFWSGFIKKIKNAVTKERVDKLEQKINTNAANIELVEQDVETNITRLENSLTNTNNELDSLEANVNGFDERITEAVNKATQAEEQATRLDLTVSSNSTKIDANTTSINNIPKVQTMTIDFSEFIVDTRYTTDKLSYQLYVISGIQVSKDRVIAMVPDIDTLNTNGWNNLTLIPQFGHYPKTIYLAAIRYEWTTSFAIAGKLRIWFI